MMLRGDGLGLAQLPPRMKRDGRFRDATPAQVLQMFAAGTNGRGQPLTQFEFEALCERWYMLFGEAPPMGDRPSPVPEPEPMPADDAMLSMRDVTRIGLSKSTIKRWVNDPASDFPKPAKLSPRRIGWRANQMKAWRKKIESAGLGRTH
jgi:predicted DNA-binding transcriptional regulator AlpA